MYLLSIYLISFLFIYFQTIFIMLTHLIDLHIFSINHKFYLPSIHYFFLHPSMYLDSVLSTADWWTWRARVGWTRTGWSARREVLASGTRWTTSTLQRRARPTWRISPRCQVNFERYASAGWHTHLFIHEGPCGRVGERLFIYKRPFSICDMGEVNGLLAIIAYLEPRIGLTCRATSAVLINITPYRLTSLWLLNLFQ